MPWHAAKSDRCSVSMPWAVIKDSDGSVVACHATEDEANSQVQALYANNPEARNLYDVLNSGVLEQRSLPFADLDVTNDGWTFEGYAVVYGQTADLGEFTEEMLPGAVRKGLAASGNIVMRHDHFDHHPVLATVGGDTLRLREDGKGMRVKADIAQHYMGEATRELVRRGDIKGMSLGMVVGPGNSKFEQRDRRPHRMIHALKRILEVSPTQDPAYSGTSAEVRSLRMLQMAEGIESLQRFLWGAYPQPEKGAETREGTEPDAETTDQVDPEPEQDEPEEVDELVVQEQRSGADPEGEAAARRRRLHMMGLTLPR